MKGGRRRDWSKEDLSPRLYCLQHSITLSDTKTFKVFYQREERGKDGEDLEERTEGRKGGREAGEKTALRRRGRLSGTM